MPNFTIWFLGFVSLGVGGIGYTIAYLTFRPVLLDWGLLQYVPALGGLTTFLGAIPLLVLTWFLVDRSIRFLQIDKM